MARDEKKRDRSRNSDKISSKGSIRDSKNVNSEDFDLMTSILKTLVDNESKKKFAKQGAIPKTSNYGSINYKKNPYKWHKTNNTNVPENPARSNILHPGTYLVIPQHMISHTPLAVIYHPKHREPDKGEGEPDENLKNDPMQKKPNRESNGNLNKMSSSRGGRTQQFSHSWRKGSLEMKVVEEEQNPCNEKFEEGKEEAAEQTDNNPKNELITCGAVAEELIDPEGRLTDTGLVSLKQQFPYFDGDFLQEKWNRKEVGTSFDSFAEELKNMRINDIFNRIFDVLQKTPSEGLQERILEIMGSDEAVEEFIEMEKMREHEEIIGKLKNHFLDFTETEIHSAYQRCRDMLEKEDEEKMFNLMGKELMLSREEEKKMQQLQMIYAMLPDIDVDYVLNQLDQLNGDMSELNKFIEELLEDRNYPKSPDFDPLKRETRKLWNYYVTNYSVTNYLKKVPDSERFFSESSVRNRGIRRDDAIEFLQKRYPDLDNFQLNEAFTVSDESILKTCDLLDKNYLPVISIDETLKNMVLTEPFIQEITFITHKDEILNYLKVEKMQKELEIQMAEEENSFFECNVCFDSNVIPSETVVCLEGHIACKNCLIMYVKTLFSQGTYSYVCLNGSCDMEYTMRSLERALDPELFLKIMQRQAVEDVDKASVLGLEKCPSCDYAYVPAPEDKLFTCLNEDCLGVTCRLCKEPNHIPLSCNEIEKPQDLQARQQVEEAMTKKLVRSCPTCSKKFIKIDGCNKISCPCGANMCYICSEIVQGYEHFNGMGGTDFHKCPLFSDNQKLHVVDVLQAGVQEKEKIKKDNPEVNFVYDPTVTNDNHD